MKLLANMGELKNGKTALLIEKGGRLEYLLASGFDDSKEMGDKWASAEYYYNITSFSKAISEIQKTTFIAKNIDVVEVSSPFTKDDWRYLQNLTMEISEDVFLSNGEDIVDIMEAIKNHLEDEIEKEIGCPCYVTSFDLEGLKEYYKDTHGCDIEKDYYEVTDIEWDYDNDEHCLLEKMYVPKDSLDIEEDCGSYEIGDAIADWLSDNFGWCVKDFDFEQSDAEKDDIGVERD